MKHKFPATKWTDLAVGLRLASAIANIEADARNVTARLHALIVHWLANDQGASWQKLIDAMDMCEENVAAAKLAKDVGASYTGTVLITIITTTYDKLNDMHSQCYQFPYSNNYDTLLFFMSSNLDTRQ